MMRGWWVGHTLAGCAADDARAAGGNRYIRRVRDEAKPQPNTNRTEVSPVFRPFAPYAILYRRS
jgi:hypothetical protein